MTRKVTEPYGKKTSIVTKFVKFRNVTEKESPKKQGVYLVKKGVQIANMPTWAFQDVPPEGGCLWRK